MDWIVNDKKRFAILVAAACVLALAYEMDGMTGGFSEGTVWRLLHYPRVGIGLVFRTVGFLVFLWGTWLALHFTSLDPIKRKKIIAGISIGYIALCGLNLMGGSDYVRDFAYTNKGSVAPSMSTVRHAPEVSSAPVEVQQPAPQVEPPLTEQEKVFYGLMDKYVPDWEKQNSDPKFLDWLEQRDPTYGFVRNDALQAAFQRLDARSVANIFLEYRRSSKK